LRQKDPSAYDQAKRFLAAITLTLLVLTGCQLRPFCFVGTPCDMSNTGHY